MIRRTVVGRVGKVGRMNVEAFTNEGRPAGQVGLVEGLLTAPIYGITA